MCVYTCTCCRHNIQQWLQSPAMETGVWWHLLLESETLWWRPLLPDSKYWRLLRQQGMVCPRHVLGAFVLSRKILSIQKQSGIGTYRMQKLTMKGLRMDWGLKCPPRPNIFGGPHICWQYYHNTMHIWVLWKQYSLFIMCQENVHVYTYVCI